MHKKIKIKNPIKTIREGLEIALNLAATKQKKPLLIGNIKLNLQTQKNKTIMNKYTVIIITFFLISAFTCQSYGYDTGLYNYYVKSGDTLSEITLMFTGTLDYFKIARENAIQNPDLIYPGDKIILSTARPLGTLKNYLNAIYQSKTGEAYKLLSTYSRTNITYDEFKRSLDGVTIFDENSMSVCADFILKQQHFLQIKIFLYEDPASWGFNLVREKYKWFIMLFDLNPTFPQEDGFIEWKCH